LNPTLDGHVQKDPRILAVYLEARRRYNATARAHHNFTHVMRDLHRALLIAEDEDSVNYSVLIPSVLLHDVGFCTPDFKKEGHDAAGARLAGEMLPPLAYEDKEVSAIAHCIRAHKGHAELPQTLEAKILYDADVLEKAGLVFLLFGGKIIGEFEETLEYFLEREIHHRTRELARGLFTRKGKELDGGRLEKVLSLFSQIQTEVTQERPDYRVSEQTLWVRGVPSL